MQLFPDSQDTIDGAAHALRAGETTSAELVARCLARIDEQESKIRAWVEVDRDFARHEAARLDAEAKAGRFHGPLHGIPVGVKDIIDLAGRSTAAGSQERLANHRAAADATLVTRLRAAGAVILGKTVTTQFASFDPPVTRNPWDLDHTPGGSSSGSAAALAAGMCLGAIGSQTGGSITRPAAFCGVAGCKPTYGRVSLHGVVPLAPTLDHPGPMARTVRDLAILLDVLAAADPHDARTSKQPPPNVVAALDAGTSIAPRLGRLRGGFDDMADPAMRQALDNTVATWKSAGATVIDLEIPEPLSEVIRQHRIIMATEVAMANRERRQQLPDDYLPNIRSLIDEGLATSESDYRGALAFREALIPRMPAVFERVDVLVCPAAVGPAPDASTTGNPAFNSPWSLTALPTICFPIALAPNGLPVGAQIVGKAYGEASLFRAAQWCEERVRDELG